MKKNIVMSLVNDEQGKGTVWSMLFCITAIITYLKGGQALIAAHLPPFHQLLILTTLAIITLFTLGCSLHMVFVGDRSERELRKEIRRRNEDLVKFAMETQARIYDLERVALQNSAIVRPRSMDNIGKMRRIVNALHQRTEEIKELLASNDKIDLIDAHELLNRRLVVIENCMSSLIGAQPVEPLEPEEWYSKVEALIRDVETDLRRVELRRMAA